MTSITDTTASRVITSLPGVEQSMRTGIVARVGADQILAEASQRSGRSVASAHVSEQRQREFGKDLEANADLVAALKHINVVPSAAGLDRIASAALQFRGAFTNLVAATTAAALTLGKSQGANQLLVQAMQDFTQTAGLRATDQADMAYLMARVIVLTQQTEREQVLHAMEEALKQARHQLAELEKQRDQGGLASGGKVEHGGKMLTVPMLEKRAGLPGAKGEAAREKLQEIRGVSAGLDKRIDALRDSIKALEKQIAGQQTGNAQMLNEVIFMLVEKAMSMARNPTGRQAAAPR